jgi:hypothetical protein
MGETSPEFLRAQAERARRLIRDVTDVPLSARLGNLPTNMKSEPLRRRRRKNPHGADRVEAARQQGEPRTVVLRGLCGPRRLEIYERRNAQVRYRPAATRWRAEVVPGRGRHGSAGISRPAPSWSGPERERRTFAATIICEGAIGCCCASDASHAATSPSTNSKAMAPNAARRPWRAAIQR